MPVIKSLFGSKKFTVALFAVLVWVVGLFGLDATTEQVGAIVSPLMAYIVGQGIADVGKGKPDGKLPGTVA